jgi:hypothetical protein
MSPCERAAISKLRGKTNNDRAFLIGGVRL